MAELIEDLNKLYSFATKVIIMVKTENGILEQKDFEKMLTDFPNAYKVSMKLYNNTNEKNIPILLAAPLFFDMKLLNLTTKDSLALNLRELIMEKTEELYKDIYYKIDESVSESAIIPFKIKTLCYTVALMINLSDYMKMIKPKMQTIEECKFYDLTDLANENSLFDMNISNNILLQESVDGLEPKTYRLLDIVCKKAMSKFLNLINSKRLHLNERDMLPSVNMLACYLLLFSMLYISEAN